MANVERFVHYYKPQEQPVLLAVSTLEFREMDGRTTKIHGCSAKMAKLPTERAMAIVLGVSALNMNGDQSITLDGVETRRAK